MFFTMLLNSLVSVLIIRSHNIVELVLLARKGQSFSMRKNSFNARSVLLWRTLYLKCLFVRVRSETSFQKAVVCCLVSFSSVLRHEMTFGFAKHLWISFAEYLQVFRPNLKVIFGDNMGWSLDMINQFNLEGSWCFDWKNVSKKLCRNQETRIQWNHYYFIKNRVSLV